MKLPNLNNSFVRRKHLVLYLKLVLIFPLVNGQYLESFNEGGARWGVREKGTGRIIIEPKFKQILDCTDDYIVIRVTSGYGVIDTAENVIVPFSPFYTRLFDLEDSLYHGYFIESSFIGPDNKLPVMYWVVDSSRTCIAMEHNPCPAWKKDRDPNIPEYLSLIQKANDYHYYSQSDSALCYARNAIRLDPQNPYTHFSRAQLSILKSNREFKRKSDFQDLSEIDSIIQYLSVAESLDENSGNSVMYENYKYYIYKHLKKERDKLQSTKSDLEGKDAFLGRNGPFLIVSPGYVKGFEFEIGISSASLSKPPELKPKRPFTTGLYFIGLSYLKNSQTGLDGYKIYLISFMHPISAGLHPIFYTNYSSTEFVLRPEVGFGYYLWNASIGYNIHTAGFKFNKINKVTFTVRMSIPLSRSKHYFIR